MNTKDFRGMKEVIFTLFLA